MTYQGLIKDKRYNIDTVLIEQEAKAVMQKQGQKVQDEARQEILREQGMDNKQIVEKSLDEFAEMGEMEAFSDMLGEMMAKQEERKNQFEQQAKQRKKLISQEVEKAERKYGVLITPKVKEAGKLP